MMVYGVFMGLCAGALFLWMLIAFRDTPAHIEAIRLLSSSSETE